MIYVSSRPLCIWFIPILITFRLYPLLPSLDFVNIAPKAVSWISSVTIRGLETFFIVLELAERIGYLYVIYFALRCALSNLFYKLIQIFACCVIKIPFPQLYSFLSIRWATWENSVFCWCQIYSPGTPSSSTSKEINELRWKTSTGMYLSAIKVYLQANPKKEMW